MRVIALHLLLGCSIDSLKYYVSRILKEKHIYLGRLFYEIYLSGSCAYMGEGVLKLLIFNKQKVVNVDYNSVNRIEWLDATRGLAVLLVIWGHIDNGAVFTKSFYCFHIPLLFWISGFLLSVDRKPVTKFIHYKIKNIAIPCMMYSIIIVLFGIFIMNNNMYYELIPQILLQIRSWPLWYMACLFILNIMGYVVIQIEKGIKRRRFYRYAVCIISVVIGVVLIMEKNSCLGI